MIRRLQLAIKQSTLARVSGATIVAQLVAVTGSVAIAKIYDATIFGTYATWLAVMAITSAVCTGSLESSLVLDSDQDRRESAILVLATSGIGAILIGLVLGCLRVIFASPASQLSFQLLELAVLSGFLFSVGTIWQSWASASGEFVILNRQRIFRAFSIAACTITSGFLVRSPTSLATGYLVGIGLSAGAWRHQLKIGRADIPDAPSLRTFWKKRIRFLRFVLPGVMVSVVTSNLLIIVIFSRFGQESAGLVALSLRVLSSPSALLGLSIRDVFRRQASVAMRERGECRTEYLRNLGILSSLAVLLSIGVLLLGKVVFLFAFDEEWTRSADISIWILPMVALALTSSPLSSIVYLTEREHWDLYWQIVLGCGTTASLFAFSGLKPTLISYSAIYSLMYIIYIAMGYRLSLPKTTYPKRIAA